MAFNLKKVLQALLFSSSQPLGTKDIQAAFARFHETTSASASEADGMGNGPASEGATAPVATEAVVDTDEDPELYGEVPSLVTATQIREAMDDLATELREKDEGWLLLEGKTGWRLGMHPRFARWVRVLRNEPLPLKLSRSVLETLAVVAYRQPVTRSEIETIRGVSADAGLAKLIERELVYVVGRAELPGRPMQYGTTDQFLDYVGVKSIAELPASDVLSNRQIDEWLQAAMDPQSPPRDEAMGLPLEEGEGASPNLDLIGLTASTAGEPAATVEGEPPETKAADDAGKETLEAR